MLSEHEQTNAQTLPPEVAGDPTAPIAEDIRVLAEAFSLLIAMDRELHPNLYQPVALPPLGVKTND